MREEICLYANDLHPPHLLRISSLSSFSISPDALSSPPLLPLLISDPLDPLFTSSLLFFPLVHVS